MKVLFVDTTTSDLVVAVIEEKNVTAVINKDTQRWHSQLLCEKVNEALTKANTDFAHLDAFACAIGPGSFTGIRIGVATVKGYATAVPRPYIALNSLEAIACSPTCGQKGSAVIDAGNGYYFADYVNGIAPVLIKYDDERASFAGRGTASDYLDGAINLIRTRYLEKSFDNDLKPLYIRRSQAEENRNDQ